MQNLALLLLLAIVSSTVFALNVPVFAQEAPADEMTEGTAEETEDETMEEEAIDDETTEEDAMEDVEDEVMEDTMMEDDVDSPRQQLMTGTDPHEIQCGSGLILVFKASNFHPACVKETSYNVLLQRGWVSDHDPTHEELTGMMEALPKDEVMEETEDDAMEEGEIELEEEIDVEEDTTAGNGTEPTPQSHTVELSESMEMGAN